MRVQVVLIKVVVSIGCHVKHFDCSGPVVRTRCTHDNQFLKNNINGDPFKKTLQHISLQLEKSYISNYRRKTQSCRCGFGQPKATNHVVLSAGNPAVS